MIHKIAFAIPIAITPIAILLNFIDYSNRMYALTIVGAVCLIYTLTFVAGPKEIGLSLSGIIPSLAYSLAFTIIIVVASQAFIKEGRVNNDSIDIYFYMFYVLVSCPLQEIVFRGCVKAIYGGQENEIQYIIVSALLYGFIHIIYKDALTFFGAAFIGIIWAFISFRTGNLVGPILSHMIFGVYTIRKGFI